MSTWNLDQMHSTIGFKVKHLMISTVKGQFNDFNGTVTTNDDTFESASVNFTAQSNSINTNNTDRDGHLKSPELFDAEQFPTLSFTSTSFTKNGEEFDVMGDLTIKGVTKQVAFKAKLGGIIMGMYGKRVAAFELSGKINRMDFGVAWNAALEAGGVVVSEEVILDIEAELIEE